MRNKILYNKEQLSPSEEHLLWTQFWDAGAVDNGTRLKIVELYLPLVASVANKLSSNIHENIEMEELLSMGVVGLHKAISSYDKYRETNFRCFAFKRIQGSILDALRRRDYLTRTQRRHYKKLSQVADHLKHKFNCTPSYLDIAKEVKMDESEVRSYLNMGKEHINLDEQFKKGLSYYEALPDYNAVLPSETTNSNLLIEELRKSFRKLKEREQKILFLRHYQDLSVKEIAVVMKISEGRISQIYKEIVLKLREQLIDK